MHQEQQLDDIARDIAGCTSCQLHHTRKHAVPGEGPCDSDIMFIGEAPGFHENEQGRPFVGAAGNFLEDLLSSIGLSRGEVFITNVVKCRPPGNRDPLPEELQTCGNYLGQQINIINPKIIVTLGRYSMSRYIDNAKISKIHGVGQQIGGRWIIPMYHPAAALHQPSLRPVIEQDFSCLPEIIQKARMSSKPSREDIEKKEEPKQLSFF